MVSCILFLKINDGEPREGLCQHPGRFIWLQLYGLLSGVEGGFEVCNSPSVGFSCILPVGIIGDAQVGGMI